MNNKPVLKNLAWEVVYPVMGELVYTGESHYNKTSLWPLSVAVNIPQADYYEAHGLDVDTPLKGGYQERIEPFSLNRGSVSSAVNAEHEKHADSFTQMLETPELISLGHPQDLPIKLVAEYELPEFTMSLTSDDFNGANTGVFAFQGGDWPINCDVALDLPDHNALDGITSAGRYDTLWSNTSQDVGMKVGAVTFSDMTELEKDKSSLELVESDMARSPFNFDMKNYPENTETGNREVALISMMLEGQLPEDYIDEFNDKSQKIVEHHARVAVLLERANSYEISQVLDGIRARMGRSNASDSEVVKGLYDPDNGHIVRTRAPESERHFSLNVNDERYSKEVASKNVSEEVKQYAAVVATYVKTLEGRASDTVSRFMSKMSGTFADAKNKALLSAGALGVSAMLCNPAAPVLATIKASQYLWDTDKGRKLQGKLNETMGFKNSVFSPMKSIVSGVQEVLDNLPSKVKIVMASAALVAAALFVQDASVVEINEMPFNSEESVSVVSHDRSLIADTRLSGMEFMPDVGALPGLEAIVPGMSSVRSVHSNTSKDNAYISSFPSDTEEHLESVEQAVTRLLQEDGVGAADDIRTIAKHIVDTSDGGFVNRTLPLDTEMRELINEYRKRMDQDDVALSNTGMRI